MSSRKTTKKHQSAQVNEPKATYGKAPGGVSFFSSFEDMEKDNYKWLASLTAEQHLENATSLIKRIFAADLKKHPHLGNKISFD